MGETRKLWFINGLPDLDSTLLRHAEVCSVSSDLKGSLVIVMLEYGLHGNYDVRKLVVRRNGGNPM